MSAHTEARRGHIVRPRLIETVLGAVEYDLTDGAGPVVLASHGGIGGVDQAKLLLNWLDPTEYRLLSCSRPGYLNTPLTSGRTFEQQADLFAALLDALDIDKAAVVTLSAGGPPGYLFATRHPDRVCALVAIASVTARHDIPETAGPITQALFMSQWGQQLTKLIAQTKPRWLLRQTFQGTAHYTKQQLQEHIDFALRSPDALAFLRSLLQTLNPYRPRLAGTDNDTALLRDLTRVPAEQVRCPTLVVHGTHDTDVKFCHGVYAHEHIPGAERFWIPDGSHLGFWLSPHAAHAQDTARQFLNRTALCAHDTH